MLMWYLACREVTNYHHYYDILLKKIFIITAFVSNIRKYNLSFEKYHRKKNLNFNNLH